MAEMKTTRTTQDVMDFIEQLQDPKKKEEARQLVSIFSEASGWPAAMWGPSIIGFGVYDYTYESGHSGSMAATGFSPRKAAHSLYVGSNHPEVQDLLGRLGKFTMGKSCVYVKKLADIDATVLKALIQKNLALLSKSKGVTLYPSGEKK